MTNMTTAELLRHALRSELQLYRLFRRAGLLTFARTHREHVDRLIVALRRL